MLIFLFIVIAIIIILAWRRIWVVQRIKNAPHYNDHFQCGDCGYIFKSPLKWCPNCHRVFNYDSSIKQVINNYKDEPSHSNNSQSGTFSDYVSNNIVIMILFILFVLIVAFLDIEVFHGA